MLRRSILCALVLSAVACSAAPVSLEKSKWVATEIGGVPVVAGSTSTLEFTEATRVAGNGGCNRFFGEVQIEGSSMKFGTVGSTKMACAERERMEQESKLFAALDSTRSFRKEGAELVLLDESSKVVVRFKPTG